MEFVKVRHKDGREAEITAAEVAFYRSIGFAPVDGSVVESPGGADEGATAPVQPPANGTDQRLDLVLDELRGLRADLAAARNGAPAEPADGETVELREPQEPETPAGSETGSFSEPSEAWTRADLDAYAAAHGVADADKLPNKQAVLDAIEAAG